MKSSSLAKFSLIYHKIILIITVLYHKIFKFYFVCICLNFVTCRTVLCCSYVSVSRMPHLSFSMAWLRVLHHSLILSPALEKEIACSAALTPHLLETCTALLMSSGGMPYVSHIETVLLNIGLHSDFGLTLIHSLLGITLDNIAFNGIVSLL